MSPSKESVWGRWLPHPGNLLTQQGSGGMLLAVVGQRFTDLQTLTVKQRKNWYRVVRFLTGWGGGLNARGGAEAETARAQGSQGRSTSACRRRRRGLTRRWA